MKNFGFLSSFWLCFLGWITLANGSTNGSILEILGIENSIEVLPTTKPWPLEYTCYDSANNPYINDIPHPTDCALFLKCVPNVENKPQPIPQICPGVLWFNFDTCNCDYPEITTCYDKDKEEHLAETFKCACPLVKNENGIYVRNEEDDRCRS